MMQGNRQQAQQMSPVQRLGRALTEIRRVQNLLELNFPNQEQAIKMQREAGDLVWAEIQRMRQQQKNQGRPPAPPARGTRSP